jgi:hypothetical protein
MDRPAGTGRITLLNILARHTWRRWPGSLRGVHVPPVQLRSTEGRLDWQHPCQGREKRRPVRSGEICLVGLRRCRTGGGWCRLPRPGRSCQMWPGVTLASRVWKAADLVPVRVNWYA